MKEHLDQIVIDVEFLLISVIQGVALTTLTVSASPILESLKWEYSLYVVSAFLFILIFWSQAIMHALGFVRWPLDLIHSFLYFLASFVEVLAFNEVTHPLIWFLLFSAFVVVSGVLFYYDLKMIKDRKSYFSDTPAKKSMYADLYKEQMLYLKLFVPLGLFFNLGCAFLIYQYPQFFIENHQHVLLVGLQVIFDLVILVSSFRTFKRRLKLV